jgi:hypothetical protein
MITLRHKCPIRQILLSITIIALWIIIGLILHLITSTMVTSSIGEERLPIDKLPEIWSLFHSTRLNAMRVGGSSQMNKHVMLAMKTGGICIYLKSLHLSFTWICLGHMSCTSRELMCYSHTVSHKKTPINPQNVKSIRKELWS